MEWLPGASHVKSMRSRFASSSARNSGLNPAAASRRGRDGRCTHVPLPRRRSTKPRLRSTSYAAAAVVRPIASSARPLRPAVSASKRYRVWNDTVDAHGKVSLRYMSKLHHIGLGRAHKGRHVKLLIADQSIRVITLDGELIRELTLDPSRDYQPLKRP